MPRVKVTPIVFPCDVQGSVAGFRQFSNGLRWCGIWYKVWHFPTIVYSQQCILRKMEKEFAWEVEVEKTWAWSSRPRPTVKTSVRVSVYMVEEKGIKIENKNTKEKYQTEMIMTATEMKRGEREALRLLGVLLDVGEENRGMTGGCLRRTISPVCGGPWRGWGTLTGAGCCCLLRSNSSYTLDTCHAFPAMVLYSLNERSGYRVAVWLALPLRSPLCTPDIPYSSLLVPERYWQLGEKRSSLSLLEEALCSPTDLVTVLSQRLTLPVPRRNRPG